MKVILKHPSRLISFRIDSPILQNFSTDQTRPKVRNNYRCWLLMRYQYISLVFDQSTIERGCVAMYFILYIRHKSCETILMIFILYYFYKYFLHTHIYKQWIFHNCSIDVLFNFCVLIFQEYFMISGWFL